MKRQESEREGSRTKPGGGISRRDLLKGVVGLGAMAALPGCAAGVARKSVLDQRDWIRRENEKPGTGEWRLTNTRIDPRTQYRSPGIEGYCSCTSVRAGDQIRFHVSTNPPRPSPWTSIAWAITAARVDDRS